MKPSSPSAAGYMLPLLPAVVLGILAATGSGKAIMAVAARSRCPAVLKYDVASVGLPFGPYAVQSVQDILIHDGQRGKDLPVTAIAPRTGGPFPVIILSHSAGGDGNQNQPLTRYWASHGYVVLCPTHADSLSWQRRQVEAGIVPPEPLTDESGPPASTGDGDSVADGFSPSGDREALRNPQRWVDRAQDVSWVLNSLDELGRRVPFLAGRMDPSHVGVVGTSWLGATTAQIVGGASLDMPDYRRGITFRDPRARAVLLLTTRSSDYLGLPQTSWTTIPAPMLAITGSCHMPKKPTPVEHLRPGADQYLIRIAGPHPLSFGGDYESLVHANTPGKTGFFPCVEDTTLAFWDASLKGDSTARTRLGGVSVNAPRNFGVTASVVRS